MTQFALNFHVESYRERPRVSVGGAHDAPHSDSERNLPRNELFRRAVRQNWSSDLNCIIVIMNTDLRGREGGIIQCYNEASYITVINYSRRQVR